MYSYLLDVIIFDNTLNYLVNLSLLNS